MLKDIYKRFVDIGFALLSLSVFTGTALAQSTQAQTKPHILIVIGYTDLGSPKEILDIFRGKYNYPLARFLNDTINDKLSSSAKRTEVNRYLNTYHLESATVSILSVNELCSAEESNAYASIRVNPCAKQIERSNWARGFLTTYARRFSKVIYLGHARGGQGFALGPPTSEYTLNVLELGYLESLYMIACSAQERYGWYSWQFARDFKGLREEEVTGLDKLVIRVIDELKPYTQK